MTGATVYNDPTEALAEAIEHREPVDAIQSMIDQGASVASRVVMASLDDALARLPSHNPWVTQLLAVPDIQLGRATRRTALDAALAMKPALATGELLVIQPMMRAMLDAEFDASYDLGGGTVLKWAVVHQCPPEVIELLLNEGEGDFGWSCPDALEALKETPDGPWKSTMKRILAVAMALKETPK
ncbi:MAG TPA: hypothetical protein VGN46_14370 [Luteibacter sp.]|jgi:hypothetical protein|uniref:hypothetical protein n=1 Tax=Luteibacter sp. TaxID=1886636 RepID=UPI002F42A0AB